MKTATINNEETVLKWGLVAIRPFFVFHHNARWRINYLVHIRICKSITRVIAFMSVKNGWHNQQRTQNQLHYRLYKIYVSTSQRTQPFPITNTYQLLLFGKIKAHFLAVMRNT
jgi:hypothetical protein